MSALRLFGKSYGKATELTMSILGKNIDLRSYKDFDHLVRPEYILNTLALKYDHNCVLNDGDDLYYVNFLEPRRKEKRCIYLVHQFNFEELFKGIFKFYFGGDSKVVNLKIRDKEFPMDINGRFRKIQYLKRIEDGVDRMMPVGLNNKFKTSSKKMKHLEALFEDKNIPLPENRTASNLLRELANIYIYPECLKPTYIEDIPTCVIPLSRNYHYDNQFDMVEVGFCGRKIGMIRHLENHFHGWSYKLRYDHLDIDDITVKYLDFMYNFPQVILKEDCANAAMTNFNAGLICKLIEDHVITERENELSHFTDEDVMSRN